MRRPQHVCVPRFWVARSDDSQAVSARYATACQQADRATRQQFRVVRSDESQAVSSRPPDHRLEGDAAVGCGAALRCTGRDVAAGASRQSTSVWA